MTRSRLLSHYCLVLRRKDRASYGGPDRKQVSTALLTDKINRYIDRCHDQGACARYTIRVVQHSLPQGLRSFWPAAGIESFGSNHFEITKEITEFCPSGLTQSSSMAHAQNGCSQTFSSSPEAALLLVNTKNRDLWPAPTTFRF